MVAHPSSLTTTWTLMEPSRLHLQQSAPGQTNFWVKESTFCSIVQLQGEYGSAASVEATAVYCRRCLALWLGGRLASSPERPLVSTMRSCQVAGILACYHTQPDDAIKLAVRAAFAGQISVSSREVEHDLNQQARALVSTCQSAGSAESAVAASFPAPQSAAGSTAEGRRGLTASQPVRQGADAFPVDTARSVITPREEDHRHESAARTADRPLLGQRQPAAGALSQDRREYGGHPVTAAGGRPAPKQPRVCKG